MEQLTELGMRAREAAFALNGLTTEEKNRALMASAAALEAHAEEIIRANRTDIENGRAKNMPEGLLDRLLLNEERIHGMAEAVRGVASLPDPVGDVLEEWTRPNGLRLRKVRVPIGVVGIIYEARPNVTSDAFSIAFKSGNAVILKGGSDAIHSNSAVADVIRGALRENGFPEDALLLIRATDHETTTKFMQMNGYVDVLIPRGSARLIQAVVKNSTVPVIETGAGNCHIFLDEGCDTEMAKEIIFNAKTQRIGVCNAAESLVVHRSVLGTVLPAAVKKLQEKNVIVYADAEAFAALQEAAGADPALNRSLIERASEEDFGTEYLDYKMSVKTVGSVEEAIGHINRYSTKHSETILTPDEAHARLFQNAVDSACVYWNASTRFTDGGEFGFGAEIGISTAKLHARGPMGLRELTTTKYQIDGTGQVR